MTTSTASTASTSTTYHGITITRAEAVQAMKRFDKELREDFPPHRWKTYAVEFNGRQYPPKTILRLILPDDLPVGGGGEPINSRFKQLGFKIVDPDQGVEDEHDAIETVFSLEQDLQKWLAANLHQLEKGLKLHRQQGQQVDAKGAGRIDLLATDNKGGLVVIELKAGKADREVCGQILAYMGWVKKDLAGRRKVRGIIVASEFTERLALAVGMMPNLALKKYTIVFKFSNP